MLSGSGGKSGRVAVVSQGETDAPLVLIVMKNS
jgi:hypothetical protein